MASSPPTDLVITVGVPVPGLGLLSYRVPPGLPRPPKGARVSVRIGTRRVIGCVVDPDASPPPDATLRDIDAVLDTEPFLPAQVVDLALWVAEYYAAGPGDALSVAMPPSSRREDGKGFRTGLVVRAVNLEPRTEDQGPRTEDQGPGTADRPSPRGPKQRAALDLLAAHPAGCPIAVLRAAGISLATVRSLAKAELVETREVVVERDPFSEDTLDEGAWAMAPASADGRTLTPDQEAAFDEMARAVDAGGFRPMLLHGITGSGKTELYARLAERVLAAGRRVLVMVPEIALTPAVAGLFRARFGDRVAIQHSGLTPGERHDQWHRIRRGDISIVVGTRSSVFAPLDDIGLVIVDEEHDGAYKQDEAPRYHGRDVAVVRARMAGAAIVLGSATPSLESAANAAAGRYQRSVLTRRVRDRPLATVRIVDMRPEYKIHGADLALSGALVEAIGHRLERGEQSLVLLNRRGFATVVFCRQCGASLECPHCSVTLTFHRAARRVRCHYCNYAASVPPKCGVCAGEFLEHSGFGTERIEADVRERFPGARVVRVDRDTIRRRGAIADVLRAVARGDVDILVGTQMIAKGHDFPDVTLVGVVSADVGLGMADFRAAERTFQLLTQVVGRAGRGDVPGEAVVQTLYPDHYSVRAGCAQDYDAFYQREMEFRTSMRYPPAVGLINVVVRAKTLADAMTGAASLAAMVRRHAPQARVVGPAPAPLARIKDEFRVQFFLKGKQRRAMREALLAALAAHPELRRRTVIDVDPISVL